MYPIFLQGSGGVTEDWVRNDYRLAQNGDFETGAFLDGLFFKWSTAALDNTTSNNGGLWSR
jgi:hypothetical protein